MKRNLGIFLALSFVMGSSGFAGEKKAAPATATAPVSPGAASRPVVPGQPMANPRFGTIPRPGLPYRPGNTTFGSIDYPMARGDFRVRNLPTRTNPVGADRPAPDVIRNAPPRRDTADDIIATIPRRPENRGGVVNNAGEANPRVPAVTGGPRTGPGNAFLPATNTNPNRHRSGDGRSVVPFNNNGDVSFNDARWRCGNWRGGDRNWWHHRCPVVILVGGGYYAWNSGWWYPAWGYSNIYSSYAYDGPIYGYDGLPPDQVIANIQGALQELGYFQYAVDGVLGPATQAALADYQRDSGLLVTGAVDRATLVALGFIY